MSLVNDFFHSIICILVGMMIERHLVQDKSANICSACGANKLKDK